MNEVGKATNRLDALVKVTGKATAYGEAGQRKLCRKANRNTKSQISW